MPTLSGPITSAVQYDTIAPYNGQTNIVVNGGNGECRYKQNQTYLLLTFFAQFFGLLYHNKELKKANSIVIRNRGLWGDYSCIPNCYGNRYNVQDVQELVRSLVFVNRN